MQVINLPEEILSHTQSIRSLGKSIGLVPTMGALHDGHFHLVKKARSENDVLVVSIFVNPIQFNNQEDFEQYPRTLEQDIQSLKEFGVDVVYAPSESDMYPARPQVSIDFGNMERVMEGAFRPGHFSGVGIVVAKLFNQTNATSAYFGKKDMQQYLLVKRMVADLSIPIKIVGVPIVRENSGLAMSSRNQRLTADGLHKASYLYKGLVLAEECWSKNQGPEETKSALNAFYNELSGLSIEYISIVSPDTLEELHLNKNEPAVICVAAYVEGVRLIDNLYLRQD